MGRNKGLPKQLTEKQELMRQQSINKVLRAIEELKAEGKMCIRDSFTGRRYVFIIKRIQKRRLRQE